ncbi:MAG: PAS domain S-box protein [Candidatus Bathyarchaeota archaeon]
MNNKIEAQKYFEKGDVIMIAINSNQIIIDINENGCRLLGYQKEEIVGKNWFDNFIPKVDRERIKTLFSNMLTGKVRHVHYEHPLISKNGKKRIFNWHNILASEDGKTIGVLSSGADVTKRRLAEKAIKKTEDRLQLTLDSMLEGYQIIDFDWRYAYVNAAAAKQGRRKKEELIGHTMMEMYPGIEKTEMFGYLQKAMTDHIPHKMENEFTFPDGSKAWFELRIEPVPKGVLILSMDVNQRKKLEQEVNRYKNRLEDVIAERSAECSEVTRELKLEIEEHKKTEEGLKLRAMILDNAKEAIYLINSKGDFVYANEVALKTYGYNRDELFEINIRKLVIPKDLQLIDSYLETIFEEGELNLKTNHIKKDGSVIPIHLSQSLMKTSHGKFIVCIAKQI